MLTLLCDKPGPAVGHPLESQGRSIYEVAHVYPPHITTDYEVELTQGLETTIIVQLREFQANPNFKTKQIWNTRNGMHELEMPPLCLANMEQTRNSVKAYIKESSHRYLAFITSKSTNIVREMLLEALRYSISNKVRTNSLYSEAADGTCSL
jgi:hypothetical protein